MKRFLLPLTFVLSTQLVFSQVYIPFRLYNYDPKLINPAFAGLRNEQNYQLQYEGWGQNYNHFPYITFTAVSLPIRSINSGVGAYASKTRIGPYDILSGSILYNYQFKLSENKRLSLGTQLSYARSKTDYSYLNLKDDFPGVVTERYAVDFGIAYDDGNFSAGFSTQNLIRSIPDDDGLLIYDRAAHLFASYNIQASPSINIKPSALLTTDFRFFYITDINAIFELKHRLLFGAGVQITSDRQRGVYNAGVIIAKSVQLIGVIYSGKNHTNYSSSPNNLELMLRVVIKNKTAQ